MRTVNRRPRARMSDDEDNACMRDADSDKGDDAPAREGSPAPSGDKSPRGEDRSRSQSPRRDGGDSGDDRSPRPAKSASRSRSRSPRREGDARRSRSPRGRGGGRGGGRFDNDKGRNGVGVSLLVRQLPQDASAEEIEEAFSKYGQIMDVYIPKDYYTKKPKGIAFVQFPNADEAADAEKALDGTQLCGVEISVQVALQKRKDPAFFQRGRGGGRGGGGGGGYRGGGGGYGRDRDRERSRDRYNPYGGRDRSRDRGYDRRERSRDRYDRRDRYDDRRGGYDRRDDYRRDRSPPRRSYDYDDRR